MKLRVVAYEGDSYHGTYRNWQERLAYYLTDERKIGGGKTIEEFWDDLYERACKKQLYIEVRPGITIGALTKNLVEQFNKNQAKDISLLASIFRGTGNTSSYLVHIPSGRRLDPKSTLISEGISDEDLLGLISVYPAGYSAFLLPVPSSAELFAIIHSNSEQPPSHGSQYGLVQLSPAYTEGTTSTARHRKVSRIWGALLYTDEDKELALYIRKHFASVSRMSGSVLHIFIIEKSEHDWRLAARYWKSILQEKLFVIWNIMGWLSTKPFDKGQAYDIGRRLGVYPDQFPCLVLFDDVESKDKLIFPIHTVTPTFFRKLFSALENALQAQGESPGSYKTIKKHYEAIVESIRQVQPISLGQDRTQYNFNGHTVFINHPQGAVNLSDFQKD